MTLSAVLGLWLAWWLLRAVARSDSLVMLALLLAAWSMWGS